MSQFDKWMLGIIATVGVLIGGVVLLGDRVGVPVRETYPTGTPPVTTDIRVRFGQRMDTETVEERFSIEPAVPGDITWEESTLIFTPAASLEVGRVYTVTVEAGAESTTGRVTAQPTTWDFHPRRPSILFLGPADVSVRQLYKLSLNGGEAEELHVSDNGIYDYAVSPDGATIVLTVANQDGSSDLWTINAAGRDAEQLFDCEGGICDGAAWDPAGERIAYERQEVTLEGDRGPSRVWVYEFETGETFPVYQDNQILGYDPVWSPDGNWLAFFDANQQVIRALNIETGSGTLIPSDMGEVGTFSADSDHMIYTDIRMVGRQFFTELMEAELGAEGGLDRLFDDAEEDQWPAYHPTDELLAFGRRRLDRQGGFGSQLMIYTIETGDLQQITSDRRYNNLNFRWDPTGESLLFTRFNLEESFATPSLWLYELGEGEPVQIIENAASGEWLP